MLLPPASRAVARSLALGSLVALSSGCSLAFVHGPPAAHAQMVYFDCTSSNFAPVSDALMATVYGASAAAQATQAGPNDASVIPIASAAIAALLAYSAFEGFSDTSDCRDAKQQWADRLHRERDRACGRDADCEGTQLCEAGLCVATPRPLTPQPLALQTLAPELP